MRRPRSDYDAAWKEIVQFLFQPLMLLCFTAIALRIDWSREVGFLDNQLQTITPGSKSRRAGSTRCSGSTSWMASPG